MGVLGLYLVPCAHMSTMSTHVFVYGTLKTGEPNHYWFEDSDNGFAELVGAARTVETFPLVITTKYNIPMLLDQAGTGKHIKGELYRIDEKMLAHLDILEAYPSLYTRKLTLIDVNGCKVESWIYLMNDFRDELLDNEYLDEYSTKILPWDTAYLEEKDGDFIFNSIE